MFDLTITFAGLCMLVPDETRGMLHVLMPFPGAHPHFPLLIYVDQAGQVKKCDITGMHLELQNVVGSNGFNPAVDDDVFDFGSDLLFKRTVPKRLLDPPTPLPMPTVRTRMRLNAGKHGPCRRRGGWWNFDLTAGLVSRRLPTAMDWLINDIDQRHLVIEDKVRGGTFTVFPRHGRIHLLIVHVTEEEEEVIGPDIPENSKCLGDKEEGSHFGLYGGLLDPPGLPTLPLFDLPKSEDSGLCEGVSSSAHHTSHHKHVRAGAPASMAATAAVAAAAAAAAAATATSATPAAAAAAATAAALSASSALKAAAAGGSELTCMITTAPPG